MNSRTRAGIVHLEHMKAGSPHFSSNSLYLEQFTFPFPPRPISLFSLGTKSSYLAVKTNPRTEKHFVNTYRHVSQ